MRYVVTGATGFIGAEFILTLLNAGNTVYAIGRNETKARTILPVSDSLNFVKAELSEFKDLDSKIPEADVFVNFAWDGITVSGRDMTDVQKLNIQYAKEAMQAAKRMGCSLFVETGSQAEYGIVNEVISEDTPCNPFSEYGKAKLALSKECDELSHTIGIRYLHLRIFSVFGLRDHEHTLIKTSMDKLQQNMPVDLSPCTQDWNFLYVKDAAKQIMLLCEHAVQSESYQSEVFNIASDDTRVLKEYMLELKSVLNSTSELNFGAVQSARIVSLNPDINKLKKAINFVSSYTFADAIREMTKQ